MYPFGADRADVQAVEHQRYYRMVLPLEPERPLLSPHPLTWTTISHVIWDGMAPETLNPAQQQAMLDWLHWGGQFVLIGGSGPSFATLRDSFLDPYLPAEPSGESVLLSARRLEGARERVPAALHPPRSGRSPADAPGRGRGRCEPPRPRPLPLGRADHAGLESAGLPRGAPSPIGCLAHPTG